MADDPGLDQEAGANLFQNMREKFFDNEMEKQGITGENLWAAQVIFISPYKGGQ
jgi:hypothetical protein